MVIKQLYKHRGKVLSLIIVAGIASYVVTQLHGNHIDSEQVQHTYTGLNHINETKVIDKNLVIEAIHRKSELVGLESQGIKHFTVSDSFFQQHNMVKDFLGNRSLEVIANTYFQTGIDLSSIHNEDIVVYGQTLFLKLSKEQIHLISLSIPFNEMEFSSKLGLFRSDFSLEDKQFIYGELKKSIENEIMNNTSIRDNTYKNISETLTALLEKIPNCTKVVIQERLK